jgi:hypothetical protein
MNDTDFVGGSNADTGPRTKIGWIQRRYRTQDKGMDVEAHEHQPVHADDEDVLPAGMIFAEDEEEVLPAGMIFGENDRPAFASTGSAALDFFFEVVPDVTHDKFISLLEAAWAEDSTSALRLIFQTGNVREGGKMNRENFHRGLQWLWEQKPQTLISNIHLVGKQACLKDVLTVLEISCSQCVEARIDGKRKAKEHKVDIYTKRGKRTRREAIHDRRLERKMVFAATQGRSLDKIYVPENMNEKCDRIANRIAANVQTSLHKTMQITADVIVVPVVQRLLQPIVFKYVSSLAEAKLICATAETGGLKTGRKMISAEPSNIDTQPLLDSITSTFENAGFSYKVHVPQVVEDLLTRVKEPPLMKWVSPHIKICWDQWVRADAELAATAKADAKTALEGVMAKMRIEDDQKSGLKATLFAAIVEIFAEGLREEHKKMTEDPEKMGGLFAKWAPTAGGACDKYTNIVPALCKKLWPDDAHPDPEKAETGSSTSGGHLELAEQRKKYNQYLSTMRLAAKVPEHFIGKGEWGLVDYDRMPSRCRLIYGLKTFSKHDKVRYQKFLDDAEAFKLKKMAEEAAKAGGAGDAEAAGTPVEKAPTVKVGALLPHEVTERAWKAYKSIQRLEDPAAFAGENAWGNEDDEDDALVAGDADEELKKAKMVVQVRNTNLNSKQNNI